MHEAYSSIPIRAVRTVRILSIDIWVVIVPG